MARSASNSRPIPKFFRSGKLPALFFLAVVLALLPGQAAAAGTWSDTDRLYDGRYEHTATLLRNGKVLVAGGYGYIGNGSWGYHTSAELYDPDSGAWTWTGSLAEARKRHTATLLPNGKVLVVGGIVNDRYSKNSAELYDPATGTWTYAGALAGARSYHTATLLPNGKVLVAGGYNENCFLILNSAELYNPATGSWTPTGSMAAARIGHTATLLPNGRVLVAGGNSAELYNPATGTWAAAGAMTTERDGHTATLLPNGKVLVAGGNSAELYDPDSDTWTATGALGANHSGHTATLLPNGQVLVAGGEGTFPSRNNAELYDPDAGAWTVTGYLDPTRCRHTATLLPNGQVLVAGGDNTDPYGDYPGFSAKLYVSPPGVFHTVTASVTGKGIILPSEGGPVGEGMAYTFFFVREPKSHLDRVVVDGTPLPMPPPTSYTFKNVTTDHTLTASFLPNLGGFLDIVTDKTLVRVIKGNTATLGVKLSGDPGTAMQVSVAKESGGNDEITVAGGVNLSFDSGNWSTYQTVTLTATGNPSGLNGIAVFRLSLSSTGSPPAFVAAKKVNADQTAINLLLLGN